MNSTKKGYLKAASIIIIVVSILSILLGLFCFAVAGMIDEEVMKESYRVDEEYTYYENADGSYYFTYMEDGTVVTIKESEIEFAAKIARGAMIAAGLFVIGLHAAKLTLAILALKGAKKNKCKKGCVIALVVLSALNTQILELVFLILALCTKDNPPITYESLGDMDEETMAN